MKKRTAEWITAGAMAACLAAACLLADRYRPETPEQSAEPAAKRAAEVIDLRILETPAPTATPNLLPATAVDLYINDETVLCTLVNETVAKSVLDSYLERMAKAVPEEEHLISVEFTGTVRIIPTLGTLPLSTPAEALEMLTADPSVLPVRVVTEHTDYTATAHHKETAEDGALEQGTKYFASVGADGLSAARSEYTYEAGELIAMTEPELELVWESRTQSVRTGTLWSEKPEGEAGKKEGPYADVLSAPSFSLPMKVSIGKYFGVSGNVFHRGIDLFAKAGTEIKTPGEGVVVYLGERGDYGMVIDIDHGNGFVSRLSRVEDPQVVLNQRVFKNEVVAKLAPNDDDSAVKPHLHWELLYNGIPYNPLYYVG